jgi:hypothetical protein
MAPGELRGRQVNFPIYKILSGKRIHFNCTAAKLIMAQDVPEFQATLQQINS